MKTAYARFLPEIACTRRGFLCGAGAWAVAGSVRADGKEDGRYAAAKAILLRQIDSGLIDGAVFTTSRDPRYIAVGRRRIAPVGIPMTCDALFDVASLTKPVVAACAALLYAEGKLDPAAPFVRYLPEHAVGSACGITVSELATHTSGFRYVVLDGSDESRFRRSVMAHLPEGPASRRFHYCCYNYILLGMIVERVSGLRLDRFAAERLFAPLGMTHSTWDAADNPLTVAFRHARPGMPYAPPGCPVDRIARTCKFPVGNAGLFATADDLRRFAEDLMWQRKFPKSYYDLMFTCATGKGDVPRSFGWAMGTAGRPSGCSEKTIYHTGSTGQTLVVDPVRGLAIILLTSRRGGHDEAIEGRRKVCDILAGAC